MNSQKLVFEEMWKERILCDTILKVDDIEFHAHKLVLCNCSSYFRALFTLWSSPDCQIFEISDMSPAIMKIILEFAYTGVIVLTDDNIQEIFMAADRYDVTGIIQACCKVFVERLSPQNCIGTWWHTYNFYYPEVHNKAFSYMLKNFEDVVASSEDFKYLSVEELTKIIGDDQLNVKQESRVFEAILTWIAHSPCDREMYLGKLLSNVRLALLNTNYLTGRLIGNKMVKRSRECKSLVMKTMMLMLDSRKREKNASLLSHRLARPRLAQAVIMAIGGWNIAHSTKSIETYNRHTNRWVDVTNENNMPRAYHGTVFLNGSVYVIGGFNGGEQFNTAHKYDLANLTWQEVACMHTRRCYVSVALLDGFIYALGGYDGEDRLETAERYEPETNQWIMIAEMNEQRSDANCTTFNSKIYMCGGYNGEICLFTAEVYNPLTDQWTFIADMSNRRSGVSIIAYANEIYAVGGFDGISRLNSVEAYNPSTNTWRPAPPMLNVRSNFSVEVMDDRLFVIGGYSGFSTMRSCEVFDVRSGMWTAIRDMKISRSALSCCVVFDLPNMADYAAFIPAPPEP